MIGSCISNEDKRYKRKNAAHGKIPDAAFFYRSGAWDLAHGYFHGVAALSSGHNIALKGLTVEDDAADALLHTLGVADGDEVLASAELTLHGVFLGRLRHARIDEQTVVGGLDAEDVLRGGEPHPSGCSREP